MKKLPIILVILIAFFAARYLLLPGFVPTHDGEYHIIRFWQFDKVFRSGNLMPRWAPDLDKGRGAPIFAFFYPLPNYIAEVFILLGFSYVKTLHLVLASGLIFSGITFYLWMTSFFKPWPSAVGAIFYILAPYHLVDVFIRGSVGEVWALTLAPLVLYLTTELVKREKGKKKIFFLLNSIVLLLLLMSHNILGLVFFAFNFVYGVVLNIYFKKRSFKAIVASYTIGLLLSSFFWLPILLEKKYVSGLDIVAYKDHFPQFYQLIIPSWGTGFSGQNFIVDQMSFQIGVPHLLVLLTAFAIYFLQEKKNLIFLFFLTVVSVTLLLMLSLSQPIWELLTFMQYFQYPWRLLSVIVVFSSFFGAFLADRSRGSLSIILILLALLFYLKYTTPVVYTPRNDSFYLTNPIWTEGSATLGNSFRVKDRDKINDLENSLIRKVFNSISLLSVMILILLTKNKWLEKRL